MQTRFILVVRPLGTIPELVVQSPHWNKINFAFGLALHLIRDLVHLLH
jgi:hypothetical protein